MKDKTNLLLIGLGGYAHTYYKGIMEHENDTKINIAGIVEPFPERCSYIEDVKKRKIPVYDKIEDFYSVSSADLAVVASPIQFHCEQVCYALNQGSHVLCEKPISATVQDAQKMIQARNRSGKVLAIGYQWSYTDEIQRLKKHIMEGVYGRIKRLKTIVLWPRTFSYYSRSWAGKRKDSNGRWVLDSVANNATAHYLHNMFYVTGGRVDTSSVPKTIQAELYRANNIENFDTVAARAFTDQGVEMMFFASHAIKVRNKLMFCYEFSEGNVMYTAEADDEITFVGRLNNGEVIHYGEPTINSYTKMSRVIQQIQNGEPVLCGPEAALSQILCINGMHESMPDITYFPKEVIKKGEFASDELIYVDGLDKVMMDCYDHWQLPGEMGISWAPKGKTIDLTNYRFYPGGDMLGE